jgi:hypothetical protein
MRGQQEVNGLAFLIDGTVQILPLPIDLDVGFVHPTAVT